MDFNIKIHPYTIFLLILLALLGSLLYTPIFRSNLITVQADNVALRYNYLSSNISYWDKKHDYYTHSINFDINNIVLFNKGFFLKQVELYKNKNILRDTDRSVYGLTSEMELNDELNNDNKFYLSYPNSLKSRVVDYINFKLTDSVNRVFSCQGEKCKNTFKGDINAVYKLDNNTIKIDFKVPELLNDNLYINIPIPLEYTASIQTDKCEKGIKFLDDGFMDADTLKYNLNFNSVFKNMVENCGNLEKFDNKLELVGDNSKLIMNFNGIKSGYYDNSNIYIPIKQGDNHIDFTYQNN